MATRNPYNLMDDLKNLTHGKSLNLETFGGGSYRVRPGQVIELAIERRPDLDPSLFDIDEDDEEVNNDHLLQFAIWLDDGRQVADDLNLSQVVEFVGEFAY